MKRTGFKTKSIEHQLKLKKAAQERAAAKAKLKPKKAYVQKRNTAAKKKKKKPKEKTKTYYKKKLWKIFSKFVRLRDGYVCVCCGKHATGSGMHGGHFITGATCPPKLYFDPTNVHAQCYHCNINLSGNVVVYEQFMIGKYGQAHVDELKRRRLHNQGDHVDKQYYIDLIEYYEQELKKLEL